MHLRSAEIMNKIIQRWELCTALGLSTLLALVFLPFSFKIGSSDTASLWKLCGSSHMEWGATIGRFAVECELHSESRGFKISSSEVRLRNLVIYIGK
jgi:hypothetical protein